VTWPQERRVAGCGSPGRGCGSAGQGRLTPGRRTGLWWRGLVRRLSRG